MCDPTTAVLAFTALASTGAAYETSRQQKSTAAAQRGDIARAEADRKAAETRAAQDAQTARAEQRRRMRSQSLLASGAQGQINSNASLLTTYGKATLGG